MYWLQFLSSPTWHRTWLHESTPGTDSDELCVPLTPKPGLIVVSREREHMAISAARRQSRYWEKESDSPDP